MRRNQPTPIPEILAISGICLALIALFWPWMVAVVDLVWFVWTDHQLSPINWASLKAMVLFWPVAFLLLYGSIFL
jgi:hypothetical protein